MECSRGGGFLPPRKHSCDENTSICDGNVLPSEVKATTMFCHRKWLRWQNIAIRNAITSDGKTLSSRVKPVAMTMFFPSQVKMVIFYHREWLWWQNIATVSEVVCDGNVLPSEVKAMAMFCHCKWLRWQNIAIRNTIARNGKNFVIMTTFTCDGNVFAIAREDGNVLPIASGCAGKTLPY